MGRIVEKIVLGIGLGISLSIPLAVGAMLFTNSVHLDLGGVADELQDIAVLEPQDTFSEIADPARAAQPAPATSIPTPTPPPTLAPPPTPDSPPSTLVPTFQPAASPTPVPARTALPPDSPDIQAIYVVERGDLLRNIAAEFGVGIWDIVDINDIPNPDSLRVGQELRIPHPG